MRISQRKATLVDMKVEEPDLAGYYTYAQYLTWNWQEMTELIKGKIYKMSPAPASVHQKVLGEIFRQIANYLLKKKCQVFTAPFDVRLPFTKVQTDQAITTVVQPDLCVICDSSKIDSRGCLGAPDWIIEILSPQTSSKDLHEKFDVYEEAGVKEYWVVHPQEQTILVYVLDSDGKYQVLRKPYVRTDLVSPMTLPELILDLALVFPNAAPVE